MFEKFKLNKFVKEVNKEYHHILVEEIFDINQFLEYSLSKKFAIIKRIIYSFTDKELYDSQLQASYHLYKNKAINMKTGEGKSLSSIIPLVLKTLENNSKSYYLSINNFLLERDMNEFKDIFSYFGITLSLNFKEFETLPNLSIIYTTGEHLLIKEMSYYLTANKTSKIDKESYFLIDEADMVLIDNAIRPVVLSDKSAMDKTILEKCMTIASTLTQKDFIIENKGVSFTEDGLITIENIFGVTSMYLPDTYPQLKLIENCLEALFILKKDEDYIIDKGLLYSINDKTGLKEKLETNSNIKQCLQFKEGLSIEDETIAIQKITFQSFFIDTKNKAAMSGTAIHEYKYFKYYGFEVEMIKPTFISKLIKGKDKIYFNTKQKTLNMIKDVEKILNNQRPVLISTTSLKNAEMLYAICKEYFDEDTKIQLLTAKNIEQDSHLISSMGLEPMITISTQIAGRGIDIPVTDVIDSLGGLHVVMFEVSGSYRIDEQLIGRTARQGRNGSVQFYYSLEDSLIQYYFSKSLKNIFYSLNLKETDVISNSIITKKIKQAQQEHEFREYSAFEHLAKFDLILNRQRTTYFTILETLFTTQDIKVYLESVVKNLFENVSPLEIKDVFLKLGIQYEDVSIEESSEKLNSMKEWLINLILTNIPIEFIKVILLKSLSSAWIQFLKESDSLQEGIQWRSRVHKDPLNEFEKESFYLFNDFLYTSRFSSLRNCIQYIAFKESQKTHENSYNSMD